MKKKMICIICPMSCHLEIHHDENGEILSVSGNNCKRGAVYAENELNNPMRILTSTVKLKGGLYKRLPVVTSGEIPKGMMFEVMDKINKIEICAPVAINDIIIENVCGLPIHIIASRSVSKID